MSKEFLVTVQPFVAFGKYVSIDLKVHVYPYYQKGKTKEGLPYMTPKSKHCKMFAIERKVAAYELETEYENTSRQKLVTKVIEGFSSNFGDLMRLAAEAEMPWLEVYVRNEWEFFCKETFQQLAAVRSSEAEGWGVLTDILNHCLFLQNCSHYVTDDGKGFAL